MNHHDRFGKDAAGGTYVFKINKKSSTSYLLMNDYTILRAISYPEPQRYEGTQSQTTGQETS